MHKREPLKIKFIRHRQAVGNLPETEIWNSICSISDFAPSVFEFARNGIVRQCVLDIEMMVIGDVDFEILRNNDKMGPFRQLKDPRHCKDISTFNIKNNRRTWLRDPCLFSLCPKLF